jgi:hypothetical protein
METDISRVAHGSHVPDQRPPICVRMVKGGSSQRPKKLTDEIINAAIDGFTAQKAQLGQRIAEFRAMLKGGSPQAAAAAEPAPRKRRKFSATARRRMREAQRLRWAKIRGESEGAEYFTTKAIKPKRRISEEGLKTDHCRRQQTLETSAGCSEGEIGKGGEEGGVTPRQRRFSARAHQCSSALRLSSTI